MGTKISALTSGVLAPTDDIPIRRGTSNFRVGSTFLTDISGNTASIATNASNITTLQGQMSSAQSNITALQNNQSSDETNIATLQSDVITLQGQTGWLPAFTPLSQSTWAWFNQGSATVTQGTKLVTLLSPSTGTTSLRGRLRGSYPSPPFTLIAIVRPWHQVASNLTNLGLIGITVTDGTKHKIFAAANFNFATGAAPPAIWVGKYTSATSASSATVTDAIWQTNSFVWLKLTDDNTNQTFSYSLDGNAYIQVLQETRTTFLTPSDIGIVITCQSASQTQGGTVVSWSIS